MIMQGRGSEKYWICLQLFCRTTPWERNFRWMHAKLRAVTWVAMCASWSTGSDRSSVCNHVCSFSRITRALGSWFTIGNTNLTRFNNFTTVHYLVSHVGANQCPNASLWNIWHQMYLRKTHPNLFCPPHCDTWWLALWFVAIGPHFLFLPLPKPGSCIDQWPMVLVMYGWLITQTLGSRGFGGIIPESKETNDSLFWL